MAAKALSENLIAEIIHRIVSLAAPQRIILFGSAATGSLTKDSDIDLLVVAGQSGQTRRESVRLRQGLRGLGFPLDVVVMTRERFEETKEVIGGLAYPAHKYGKVIYEAS